MSSFEIKNMYALLFLCVLNPQNLISVFKSSELFNCDSKGQSWITHNPMGIQGKFLEVLSIMKLKTLSNSICIFKKKYKFKF